MLTSQKYVMMTVTILCKTVLFVYLLAVLGLRCCTGVL